MTLSLRDRDLQGWAGSALLHTFLLVLFLLIGVGAQEQAREFAEMVLLSPPVPQARAEQTRAGVPAAATPDPTEASTSVRLPERPPLRVPGERTIPVPPRKETELSAIVPGRTVDRMAATGLQRPDTRVGTPQGEKATPPVTGSREGTLLPEEALPGSAADGPFRIQWEGSRRDIVTSALPKIPAGVDRDVELQFRFGVTPAGEVTNIRPLQKGDPVLEEAALAALRQWRFQSLPNTAPRAVQEAVITFRFRFG